MVKRVDNAVFQTIKAARDGNFPGGEVQEFGLEENGVSLAPFGRFDDMVPQNVKDQVDQARQNIISGETEVPSTP